MLADAVVNKHSSCQSACGESCVPSNEQRLESRQVQTKHKLCIAQSTVQTATAKAVQNEAAAKAAKYQKQKHTTSDQRRVEIDRSNETLLSDSYKSCAKTTPRTGLIDTILYWARGSVPALLLLLSLLLHFCCCLYLHSCTPVLLPYPCTTLETPDWPHGAGVEKVPVPQIHIAEDSSQQFAV